MIRASLFTDDAEPIRTRWETFTNLSISEIRKSMFLPRRHRGKDPLGREELVHALLESKKISFDVLQNLVPLRLRQKYAERIRKLPWEERIQYLKSGKASRCIFQ